MSISDKEKFEFLINLLTQENQIIYAAICENGYLDTVFNSADADEIKIIFDKLSPSGAKKVVDSANDEENRENFFHIEKNPERLDMVLSYLSKNDIEAYLKAQNTWGNTPFHVQTPQNTGIISKYITPEVLNEILNIKNAYYITAKEAIDIKRNR